MAYQQNIPQPTDRLKDSQQDILDNFQAIKQLIDVNHATFGSATEGKHTFIELPTATPTGTTLATPEVALYSKNGATSGVPELYFQRNNLAADSGYAITEGILNTNGWTRLPSKLIMQWGTITGVTRNALKNFNIPQAAGSNYSTIFNVQLTVGNPSEGTGSGAFNQAIILSSFSAGVGQNFKFFIRQLTGLPGSNTNSVFYTILGVI